MKNLYRNMLLVAAAAMSFASCSEDATEELAAPARQTKTITVNADITRTEFGASRDQIVWSDNDQFGVYTDKADQNVPSGTYAAAVNGAFAFKVDAAATAIYAYYPYYSGNNSHAGTAVNFGIPDRQTWNGPGILYGKNIPMAASGTIEGSNVSLSFKPLACVLALNVYGGATGETLSSITLTTNEASCGRVDMDITKNPVAYVPTATTVTLSPYSTAEKVVVDAAAVDNQQTYANQVYLVVAKGTYAEGAQFVVTTSENTYTFTTKAALDCTASDFKAINLDLKKGEKPAPFELPEGDYIIVASNADATKFYALTNVETSSSTVRMESKDNFEDVRSMTSYTTDDNSILWHIAKSGDNYVITDVNGQYLSWTSGNSASLSSTSHPLIISHKEGVYQIKDASDKTRILARNNSNSYFAFYTGSGYNELYLVPAEIGVVEKCTINSFSAEWTDATQTAVALSGTYTSTYATEPTWTLTVSKDSGVPETLEVTADAGEIVSVNNYSITEDGTYVFTLTASVNGSEVATKTAEITKRTISASAIVLTGDNIAAMSNSGTGYGTEKTIIVDGYTWTTTGWQDGSHKNMIQLRVRTNSKGGGYVQLPTLTSGSYKRIIFSVTNASAGAEGGTGTSAKLQFQANNGESSDTIVLSAGGSATNEIVLDFTTLAENYTSGYITADGGVRIWKITIEY